MLQLKGAIPPKFASVTLYGTPTWAPGNVAVEMSSGAAKNLTPHCGSPVLQACEVTNGPSCVVSPCKLVGLKLTPRSVITAVSPGPTTTAERHSFGSVMTGSDGFVVVGSSSSGLVTGERTRLCGSCARAQPSEVVVEYVLVTINWRVGG